MLAHVEGRNARLVSPNRLQNSCVLAIAQSETVFSLSDAKRHLLDFMIGALPDFAIRSKTTLGGVSWLEAYATTYRYPKPGGRLG